MTGLFDGLVAVIVAVVLNAAIASRIRSALPYGEGRFLTRTYLLTLVLRCGAAVLLNIYASDTQFAAYFWGDSSTYDHAGYRLALSWSGDITAYPRPLSAVSGYGFMYWVGFLYFIFGRNQLLVQFVNATIGALSVVVIYAIARKLFDEGVARWAALFMAFFPQMVFWSCAMYKDPMILLCIAVAMYAVLSLRERLTAGHLFLFVGATLALMTLRFYVFYMVSFATIGTYLISQRRGVLSGLVGQLMVGGLLVAALGFGVRQATLIQQTSYFDLESLQRARLGPDDPRAAPISGPISTSPRPKERSRRSRWVSPTSSSLRFHGRSAASVSSSPFPRCWSGTR